MNEFELPNLSIEVPDSVEAYVVGQTKTFQNVFYHLIGHIQADEVNEIKTQGKYVLEALLDLRPQLTTAVTLSPNNRAKDIREAVESLSVKEIDTLLNLIDKKYPTWSKILGPLVGGLLNSIGYASLDDMFEIDSRTLAKADKKLFNATLKLALLVGLTIPEELARGSRVQTYLDRQKDE